LSLGAWFYAIAHLPLATAMTLNYMSGVWIAAFIVGGAILYGRPERQGPLLATVLAGFIGVVLTLRPTMDQNQLFAGVIGLLSGMGAALAYLQVTALGRVGEPEARTVFYFAVRLCGGGRHRPVFHRPHALVRGELAGRRLAGAHWRAGGGLGQWCMTRAYSHGSTLVVANLQYSGIVFASVYSLLLFGDKIALIGWLGMEWSSCASGLAATALRARALPNPPGEEH
jgi:S-adenosylmethionine uptake transporter